MRVVNNAGERLPIEIVRKEILVTTASMGAVTANILIAVTDTEIIATGSTEEAILESIHDYLTNAIEEYWEADGNMADVIDLIHANKRLEKDSQLSAHENNIMKKHLEVLEQQYDEIVSEKLAVLESLMKRQEEKSNTLDKVLLESEITLDLTIEKFPQPR